MNLHSAPNNLQLKLNGLMINLILYPDAGLKDLAVTCDAIVEEQDTQRILGEQEHLIDPGKPTWYLTHTLQRDDGQPLGSICLRHTRPLRLQAIVHDLDADPVCHPDTLRTAYKNLFQVIHDHSISRLAMPLLGSIHGNISCHESLSLLLASLPPSAIRTTTGTTPKPMATNKALAATAFTLKNLWLLIPATEFHQAASLSDQLSTALNQRHN